MTEKNYLGRIEIPGFSTMMLGDYLFPRDPTRISYGFSKRTMGTVILGSDIAELQEMGSGFLSIDFNVILKTDAEVDDFRAAIRKEGERRFYISSSRFFKVVGTTLNEPREGTSPIARRCSATLVSKDPFKYAHASSEQTETITSSGQAMYIDNDGSAYVHPTFTFTAKESIDSPVISDGTNSVTYATTLTTDDVLIINSDLTCTKNGVDDSGNLTITNDYPRLEGNETGELTIEFTSGASSTLKIEFRERWW